MKERIYLGPYEVYREHKGSPMIVDLERETLHVSDDSGRICMVETKTVENGSSVGSPVSKQRFQYSNHLGTAALEVDENGGIISYEEFHPFGTTSYRAKNSGIDVSPKRYRYIGKERDDETGLYYCSARYYACWLGRWASSDPIGLAGGINRYAYSNNNPVRLRDPGGTKGIGGLVDKVEGLFGGAQETARGAVGELSAAGRKVTGSSGGTVSGDVEGGGSGVLGHQTTGQLSDEDARNLNIHDLPPTGFVVGDQVGPPQQYIGDNGVNASTPHEADFEAKARRNHPDAFADNLPHNPDALDPAETVLASAPVTGEISDLIELGKAIGEFAEKPGAETGAKLLVTGLLLALPFASAKVGNDVLRVERRQPHIDGGGGGGGGGGRPGNGGGGGDGGGGGGRGGRGGGGTSHTIRSRLRDAGLHGLPGGKQRSGSIRFRPPVGYNPANPLPRGSGGGYLDRFGNEWQAGPYHGEPGLGFQQEWDVQLSPRGQNWFRNKYPGERVPVYINVRPDGFISH